MTGISNLRAVAANTHHNHWHLRVTGDVTKGFKIERSWRITAWMKRVAYWIPYYNTRHIQALEGAIQREMRTHSGTVDQARITALSHKDVRKNNSLFSQVEVVSAGPRAAATTKAKKVFEGVKPTIGKTLLTRVKSFFTRRNVVKYYTPQASSTKNGGRGFEALCIFARTQIKRLARLLSFGYCKRYYSEYELERGVVYAADRMPKESFDRQGSVSVQNIGHATQLVQTKGVNILIDPVFGDLNKLFYPRKNQPAVKGDQLPIIDTVLISHNHRDHVDEASLVELLKHQPQMLVPMGDGHFFRKFGFTHVVEHNWWEETTITKGGKEVKITAVAADHWSGRNGHDGHESLTVGWVIDGHTYDAGDTAKLPKEWADQINSLFPNIMVNIQPGGPNNSRTNMKATHQSYTESLEAHLQHTNARDGAVLWINHHNTFELGTDRFNEAKFIHDAAVAYVSGCKTYPAGEIYSIGKRGPEGENLYDYAKEDLNRMLRQYGKEKVLTALGQAVFPRIGESGVHDVASN